MLYNLYFLYQNFFLLFQFVCPHIRKPSTVLIFPTPGVAFTCFYYKPGPWLIRFKHSDGNFPACFVVTSQTFCQWWLVQIFLDRTWVMKYIQEDQKCVLFGLSDLLKSQEEQREIGARHVSAHLRGWRRTSLWWEGQAGGREEGKEGKSVCERELDGLNQNQRNLKFCATFWRGQFYCLAVHAALSPVTPLTLYYDLR